MFDKTYRNNGKWARVTGKRGDWRIALGWQGQFTATRVQRTATKLHAQCIAENYVNDAG